MHMWFFLEIDHMDQPDFESESVVLPKIVAVPAAALAPVSAFASCNFYIEMLITFNHVRQLLAMLRLKIE
jgi:hypothetical protein